MPKGQLAVMKTGFYPIKVRLKLFFNFAIKFFHFICLKGLQKIFFVDLLTFVCFRTTIIISENRRIIWRY